MSAEISPRPTPGPPRPYDFPAFERGRLACGAAVLSVHLPGRPIVSVNVLLANGAVDEPADEAGATVLAARALTEGTERRDAVALIEAAERLGAEIRAEASWDAMFAGVDVPASRLAPALDLLAEVVREPTFPDREIERLRDQRLNDLLQARADPRRRAEEAFAETIYTGASPYGRPAGGTRETVAGLTRDVVRRAYLRGVDPHRTTFVVGGDLSGTDVPATLDRLFADWSAAPDAHPQPAIVADSSIERRLVRLIDRPGSVQSEVRVGQMGLARRIPDFHALQVMAAILGGLFNSRLNRRLREEKGYTYGANAGFDLRRGRGPFVARAAVNTDATVPAISDLLIELDRMRDERVGDDELAAARDYLVGVFPLRFETPGPVVGAISGLTIHGLPDDELARYRPAIESVDAAAVQAAARDHIDPDRLAIVVVGDADAVEDSLSSAGFGDFSIERDEAGPAGAEDDPDDAGGGDGDD